MFGGTFEMEDEWMKKLSRKTFTSAFFFFFFIAVRCFLRVSGILKAPAVVNKQFHWVWVI
jgi:hypothetical protein